MEFLHELRFGGDGVKMKAALCAAATALIVAGCGSPTARQPVSSHRKADKTTNQNTEVSAPPTQPQGTTVATAPPPELQKIDMLSQTAGWALLSDGSVLKTSDGGAQWTDATPPVLQGTSPASVKVRAAFPDAQHAVLFIGTENGGMVSSLAVYATSDGGASWTTAAVPLGQRSYVNEFQVQFVNDNVGYVLLHDGVAAGSEGVTLLRSVNGGSQWTIAANGTPTAQNPPLIFGGDKSGFGFLNPLKGWITGQWAADSILLYATDDGGAHWSTPVLPIPSGLNAAGGDAESLPPVFFGPSDAVMPVEFQASGGKTVFYLTTDGGATWTPTTSVPTESSPAPWSFANPSAGFVITNSATLYRTTDGGAQWTAVQPNISLQNTTELDFVSAQTGWAVVNGSLLATSNGGQTWTQVPLSIAVHLAPTGQN